MSRQPFRMFADFTGADSRLREPEPWCPTCGKPAFDGRDCANCEAWWIENPPPLEMDERTFAPVDPEQGGPDLGFIDRAYTPVGAMRRSIHRSHRGEGHNFVD